jgi:plastocyanin
VEQSNTIKKERGWIYTKKNTVSSLQHFIKKGGTDMKKKRSVFTFVLLAVIVCLAGIAFAAEKKAEELSIVNKIITVTGYEGAQPSTLTSGPGTTVVWVNHDRQPVEILFLDKKVVLACGSPVNFFVGKDGAYESGKMPFGGTASLCFTEKGKYEYRVRASRTFYPGVEDKLHEGVIWIK